MDEGFPFLKQIPYEVFRKYFLEATDREMLALKFVDVNERNLDKINDLLKQLKAFEIYVTLWSQTLGYKSMATVRISSLKEFNLARTLTFQESERQYLKRDRFFGSTLSVDAGYRTLLILVPKIMENLQTLKAWAERRGEKIPQYYRKDFEALEKKQHD